MQPQVQLYRPAQMSVIGQDPAGGRGGVEPRDLKLVVGEMQDRQGAHKLALPLQVLDEASSPRSTGTTFEVNDRYRQDRGRNLTPLATVNYFA